MAMNKKLISSLIFIFFFYFQLFSTKAYAVENPQSVSNNKIGIHILFDHELKAAAELVNTNGGDWGYTTIVIQSGDKDLEKWQKFMDLAKQNHIIPIIRLSTEGDYFNTQVWRKPTDLDIIDFANFLDSLDWPTKNRYVIIFNEVNRGEEWGGILNPKEYAELLSFAVTIFKSKNPDYFIIPAGLDNAAPNVANLYMDQYNFMRQMNTFVPGIFNQVDGLSSHSYPNPGFSQPPNVNSPMGINSFQYEQALVKSLMAKNLPAGRQALPVFITETGWSAEAITDAKIAEYYKSALNSVWNNPNIVAITPFLLQGSGGPFQKFSFFDKHGGFSQQYLTIKNIPKVKGAPVMPNKVLAAETKSEIDTASTRIVDFAKHKKVTARIVVDKELKGVFKWLLKISY